MPATIGDGITIPRSNKGGRFSPAHMASKNYSLENFAFIVANYRDNNTATAERLGIHRDSVRKAMVAKRLGKLDGVTPMPIDSSTAINDTPQVATQAIPQVTTQVTPKTPANLEKLFQLWAQEKGLIATPAATIASVAPSTKKAAIIVSWELRVKPDLELIDCLKQLAQEIDAQLYCTLTHPEDLDLLPDCLKDFQPLLSDLQLNENCWFRYRRTNALVQRVTTPYHGVFHETAIIPGLGKELVTLPIPANAEHAKQVMTAPSIGRLDAELSDYRHIQDESALKILSQRWAQTQDRKLGAQYSAAQSRILPAALIVEIISDKLFTTRYVTKKREGILYDLNRAFVPGHSTSSLSRPLALNIGDIHEWEKDPLTMLAVKDMADVLKPEWGIVNDFFDGASCNHWTWNDAVIWSKCPTLEQEGSQAAAYLREVASWFDSLKYLHSNHDNFLSDYLREPRRWRPADHYACSKLIVHCHETNKHPIQSLLEMDSIPNLEFIPEDQSLMVGGIAARHGHIGVSGAKANFYALAKVFRDYMQAHTHSPGVWLEATMCGLSEVMNPRYRKGASGWWSAHTLAQPDSSQQVLPNIGATWRRN